MPYFSTLPDPCRKYAATRQCLGDDGSGATFSNDGLHALPNPARHGGLWGWWLHDEQPGARNRRALAIEPLMLLIKEDVNGMIRWKQAGRVHCLGGLLFGPCSMSQGIRPADGRETERLSR